MINKRLFILLAICSLFGQVTFAQNKANCKADLTYENHNQVDPSTLTLSKVSGIAEDRDQVPIPYVCLGLFTEKGHKLVARSSTNQDGNFDFSSVVPGRYRLIAIYKPFCTLNTPIRVVRRFTKNKMLRKRMVIHMELGGVDSCSYADYK